MSTYGIGHTDTIFSCWYLIDAINQQPNFNIEYPTDHQDKKQRQLHAVLKRCQRQTSAVVLVHPYLDA